MSTPSPSRCSFGDLVDWDGRPTPACARLWRGDEGEHVARMKRAGVTAVRTPFAIAALLAVTLCAWKEFKDERREDVRSISSSRLKDSKIDHA